MKAPVPPVDRELELAAEAAPRDYWLASDASRGRECGAEDAGAIDLSTAETLLSDSPWLTLRWVPSPPRLVIEAAGAYAEIPAAALMPAAALLDVLAAGAALGPGDDSAPLTPFGLGYAAGAARELAHRCAGGGQ